MVERPPAGWYRDPGGSGQRYWDGRQWTEYRAGINQAGPSPPGQPSNGSSDSRAWWQKKRFMMPAAFALGLLIGVTAGLGSAGEEMDELRSQLQAAQQDADDAHQERADALEEVDALEERSAAHESTIEELEAEVEDLTERVETAGERARAALAEEREAMEAEFAERSAELGEREAAVQREEEIAAKSTFGSGTWEVGEDILPGSYRAPGGSNCYWARLGDDGESILQNHYSAEPGQVRAVIQPSDGYFETRGCVEWERTD